MKIFGFAAAFLFTVTSVCGAPLIPTKQGTTWQYNATDEAGLPALHVISIIAAGIFAGIGACIYRRRHQLFDRDPQLADYQDGPAVRHVRLELVVIVWGALMLVMLATLYAIWCE